MIPLRENVCSLSVITLNMDVKAYNNGKCFGSSVGMFKTYNILLFNINIQGDSRSMHLRSFGETNARQDESEN